MLLLVSIVSGLLTGGSDEGGGGEEGLSLPSLVLSLFEVVGVASTGGVGLGVRPLQSSFKRRGFFFNVGSLKDRLSFLWSPSSSSESEYSSSFATLLSRALSSY